MDSLISDMCECLLGFFCCCCLAFSNDVSYSEKETNRNKKNKINQI